MSLPPTLVIHDDEERTIVDPRFQRREAETAAICEGANEEVVPGRRAEHSSFTGGASWVQKSWKQVLAVALLLTMLSALGVIAYRERAVADSLRARIDELSRIQRELLTTSSASMLETNVPMAESPQTVAPLGVAGTVGRAVLEKRGANLLFANHHETALKHYRALAARFPGEPVFADFVAVLEWKLRCKSHGEPGIAGCR